MVDNERLARIESKLDYLTDILSRHSISQGEKNAIFFETEKRVTILEATAGGAWKTLAALGTISAILGATFAWIIEHPISFGNQPSPPPAIRSDQ